jgi:hypothetical protein
MVRRGDLTQLRNVNVTEAAQYSNSPRSKDVEQRATWGIFLLMSYSSVGIEQSEL